ncbi:MAG: bifunctional precorrin-2 dehydrogenase/sirohydrochlorin ferrochelatase [Nitrosopumilus sp.]|uniref:precorrin-2 dehydrogenase/sirohydrochlorin ferrochelatase family protein n=1 Tax=Nitrosopumilus sp. TaxID=2024843 RepID=UPI00247C64E6|nr:bifunctional precorrin-2 dehydrogenase/sirohydrochlorin ferrochelatase [Nitrosopumilus sp.]MCV0391774.1 bifunctional precorrin-2 dehydrogenase/sirohydrochlorin ferrochelatase [Nitrosopumilus sp.]
MIVDLNLHGKEILIIGGGNEAQKRINSLLNQNCNITVISDSVNSTIKNLGSKKKIKLEKKKMNDTTLISKLNPDIIITTTNDSKLNSKIINFAKKRKIIVYSSDNPEESDFSNPAIIDFEKIIQIAIFTGGRSPAMAKKLKTKSEQIFKKIITKEDLSQIKIQKIARKLAKEQIPTQLERKEYLHAVLADKDIDQLIKDGNLKKAEKRAITILRNWK